MIYKFFKIAIFTKKSLHRKLTGSYKRVAVIQNEFASLCMICKVILGHSYSRVFRGLTQITKLVFPEFSRDQGCLLSTPLFKQNILKCPKQFNCKQSWESKIWSSNELLNYSINCGYMIFWLTPFPS